jgi:hypothetical protein
VVGKPPKGHTNDHAPTFEEAKAQLEAAWRRWLDWAQLQEKLERQRQTTDDIGHGKHFFRETDAP